MSKEKLNPKKSLDAIISQEIPVELDSGETINIKPISISTLAVLDSIGSPIVTGEKISMINFLSTLYVIIKGYKAAFTQNAIIEDAFEYFDKKSLTHNDFNKLKDAILIQLQKILNIQPEQSTKKK